MYKVVIFSALLAIAFSLSVEQKLLLEDPKMLGQFEDFMFKYEKSYDSREEALNRFYIFKKNVEIAAWYQSLDSSAEYGVTKFSDLSEEEFKTHYLNLQVSDSKCEQGKDCIFDNECGTGKCVSQFPKDGYCECGGASLETKLKLSLRDAPASFDWRDHGAVTPVKDQGQCGSCWAFSTVANLEGQYFLKNGDLKSFSEQQLVDCDTKVDQGCNGGLMEDAFTYLEGNGFETEGDYPYTAVGGKCQFDTTKAVDTVASFVFVDKDEGTIASTLATVGPLSAAVNASPFQHYKKGILDPLFCSKSLDHGITLVGYGNGTSEENKKAKDFWIIKNSWGADWGESGYIRLRRGKGKCGINTHVVTATIA